VNPEEHHTPIASWPVEWPGQTFVKLDNLGDPGFWLEQHLPDPMDVLGDPTHDEECAEELAHAYLRDLKGLGFPLPWDFDFPEEEAIEAVNNEFLGFIREWRTRCKLPG
jgi:hypothetical protein